MIGRNGCVPQAIRRNFVCKFFLGLITAMLGGQTHGEEPPNPLIVGAVRSLSKNVPERLVKVTLQPFPALMQAQTGYSCEVASPTDGMELGRRIANKKVQLGVFQGIEFALERRAAERLEDVLEVPCGRFGGALPEQSVRHGGF